MTIAGHTAAKPASDHLARLLIRSDRNYFRAGAHIEAIFDHAIVRVDGLHYLGAGCVLEGGPPTIETLRALTNRLQAIGARAVRFYVEGDTRSAALSALGFSRTIELAMAMPVDAPYRAVGNTRASVRPATPEDDATKLRIFASDRGLPDGKEASPDAFVALERRKIDAGYMKGFLVELDGEPAACFSLSFKEGFLRLKNIYVVAYRRGLGLAGKALDFAHAYAVAHGARGMGAFAFPDHQGHRLYRRVGMQQVGAQTEFYANVAQLKGVLAS